MTSTNISGAASLSLDTMIGDNPAAVLLVDIVARAVVHANPVAAQLAPGVSLPVDLDAWSDAAELRDARGEELSDGEHPLSRVLRAEPVLGQAVTAARDSELGRQREPLWMVGLPMREAPGLDDHALVVLLPARGQQSAPTATTLTSGAATGEGATLSEATGPDSQDELRERALLATGLSFTVADARSEDQPLVWVNPAFTRTTGYTFEEAVGTNCRFLQGPLTDPEGPAAIRRALSAGEAVTTTLMNYTKDGLGFWNQVTISPIYSGEGELTHFVGIQTDVTGRIEADRERDAALVSERRARAEAEAAHARLRLLAEATSRLSATLDVRECRARLIDLVVPRLGDWVLVLHLDVAGRIEAVDLAHADPGLVAQVEVLSDALRERVQGEVGLHELLVPGKIGRRVGPSPTSGSASGLTHLPASRADRSPGAQVRAEVDAMLLGDGAGALVGRSAVMALLPGRQPVSDVMVLVRGADRPEFDDDDLGVAVDLGRRAGLILDNARLFSVEQRIAETLQRSLLPALPPTPPGIRAAARYQASESGSAVGGDFYELLVLPDRSVGLAVGDVSGHDVLAAAAMGHLKGVLRACAYDESASPSDVLQRVDSLLSGLGMPTMATAVYAEIEPSPGGWTVAWSSAGHPPLLVRHPDGTVEVLGPEAVSNDLMLGVQPGPRRESLRELAPGTVVVGYTDGLVERRGEVLDTGLQRLVDTVAAGPADVDALCEHIVAELGRETDDDVVVIALQLGVAG